MLCKDDLVTTWVERFHLANAGVVAESTRRKHERVLQGLLAWLAGRGVLQLDEVTSDLVRQYVAFLLQRKSKRQGRLFLSIADDGAEARQAAGLLSLQTVDKHVRTVRRFFNWCQSEGALDVSPMRSIPNVRLPKNVPPKYLTTADCQAMLTAALRLPGPALHERRNRAIVQLMRLVGSGELARLRLPHVDGHDLHVESFGDYGRGRHVRTVTMDGAAADALAAWLEVRPAEHDAVFVYVDERSRGAGRPMTQRAIYSAYLAESRLTAEQRRARRDEIAELMFYRARRLALLLFFADTGARLGGVVGLKLDQLDLERRRAIVTEKGSQARAVFFSLPTAAALEAWLVERNKRHEATGRVFLVSHKAARDDFNTLARLAGVEDRPHNPHALRHAFARSLLLQGVSIGVVSRMMGHSGITVTSASYGVFADHELQQIHAGASPVAYLLNRQ